MRLWPLLLLFPLLAWADPVPVAPTPAPERLVWNKVPLRVELPVGRERLLLFPVPVRLGMPGEIQAKSRLQILPDGTVYWTANEAFPAGRVQVEALSSGNIYLLDVSAHEAAPDHPLAVVLPEGKGEETPPPAPSGEGQERPPLDYVALTRMAAHHLYAPLRLVHIPEGVHKVPVGREATYRLYRGRRVLATPLMAWRAEGLYVTAVKLENTTPEEVVLDPRRLRGQWLTCTFQHARLLPSRDRERSVTAAYLISSRPFEEALGAR